MSVKQLKDYCRNNRIKGYSTLKKSELIVLVKKVNRKSNLVKKSRKPSRKPKKTSRKPKKTSRKPKKTSRKPKKTSRKPMKSQMSDILNKSQKEYLKKLEKAINEVSKMIKKVSRKPKKTSRKPKKTSRKPKKTSRKPKKTSRKPKKTSRKPKKTSRKPKKTSRKPVKKSRKPKKVRKYKAKTSLTAPASVKRARKLKLKQTRVIPVKHKATKYQDFIMIPGKLNERQEWINSAADRFAQIMPTKEEFEEAIALKKKWRSYIKEPDNMKRFRINYIKMRYYAVRNLMLDTFENTFPLLKNPKYKHYIMSMQKPIEYKAGLSRGAR